MNKFLKIGIVIFSVFFISSVVIYFVAENKNTGVSQKEDIVEEITSKSVDISTLTDLGTWHEITEEDKITLALSAETSIISDIKQYLRDNKIAIFFVYGGPFDYNLKGNYIICTGFNENGKAKILYPDDNFNKEWTYSFEGLIEFSTKVMLFEM